MVVFLLTRINDGFRVSLRCFFVIILCCRFPQPQWHGMDGYYDVVYYRRSLLVGGVHWEKNILRGRWFQVFFKDQNQHHMIRTISAIHVAQEQDGRLIADTPSSQ